MVSSLAKGECQTRPTLFTTAEVVKATEKATSKYYWVSLLFSGLYFSLSDLLFLLLLGGNRGGFLAFQVYTY